jgi:lipoprotein-anchoring transpeptidase ErfK/SrfK
MRKFSLILAAVVGLVLPLSSAADAQTLFELLFRPRNGAMMPPPGMQPGMMQPQMQPQMQPPGQALYPEQVSRGRVVPAQYRRTMVWYQTNEKPGTIIVDTRNFYLYFILGNGQAVRYGVGVGREGFGWDGAVTVARKAEWPAWHPPKDMIAREARRGHILPARMEGGPGNPLGARALYLHDSRGRDTLYRIHGTSEPWTIGLNVSSGCIRMVNDDVVDLYQRVNIGAKVIVI